MALISKTSKINAEKITARQVVENTNSPKNLESEKIVEKKKEPSNKNEITKESVAKRKLSDQILKKRKSIANPVRDEVSVKIEKILEEGLEDAYQRLSPIAKQEFKLKGEQTALKIRDLLRDTHIKVKKILQLILNWLRILPGINHFFLEQEAKIKTDRIIRLNKL